MLIRIVSTLVLALLFSTMTSAHSPDKVRKQAKKPQCEAFLKTPREEIDASDPVTRAMMKKCKCHFSSWRFPKEIAMMKKM